MAMNQNNFNKTLQEFSQRISKVQDLFIDIQHELKNLKQENVVVSTSQERKPKVEEPEVEEPKKEDETSKEVSLTITEKEEPKKEDEKKEEEVNK